jgi:hypothetical protein
MTYFDDLEECPECGSSDPGDVCMTTDERTGQRVYVCQCGCRMPGHPTQAEDDDERAFLAECRWESDHDR